jgi:hypothetical protein
MPPPTPQGRDLLTFPLRGYLRIAQPLLVQRLSGPGQLLSAKRFCFGSVMSNVTM